MKTILVSLMAFAIWASVIWSSASAEERLMSVAELEEVVKAKVGVTNPDFAGLWDVLWPQAKLGNIYAKEMIAGAMIMRGLVPPGADTDNSGRLRHMIIWLVYAAPFPDRPEFVKHSILNSLTRPLLMDGLPEIAPFIWKFGGGREFVACLKQSEISSAECVQLAVKRGLVPSFEQYSAEIERAASAGLRATINENTRKLEARRKQRITASQPAQEPRATSPADKQSKAPGTGSYVVQVAARESKNDALAEFAEMQKKYPRLLSGYEPILHRANLGNKGIWYRLNVGPVESRKAAKSLCGQLKSAGLRNCVVRRQ